MGGIVKAISSAVSSVAKVVVKNVAGKGTLDNVHLCGGRRKRKTSTRFGTAIAVVGTRKRSKQIVFQQSIQTRPGRARRSNESEIAKETRQENGEIIEKPRKNHATGSERRCHWYWHGKRRNRNPCTDLKDSNVEPPEQRGPG